MNKSNEMIRKYPIIREIFLYGIIGALSAGLDSLSFLAFRNIGLGLYVANFISINLGITMSFVLNTYLNFKKKDNILKRAVSFYAVGYFGLILSMLIVYIFITKLHFHEFSIKLASIVIIALVQFVLNKIFTYGRRCNK